MIRTRYMFLALSSVAIFAVVLVLLAINSVPASAVPPISSTFDTRDVTTEQVELQTDTGASNPITTEPSGSQVAPLPDGPSVIANQCNKCHTNEWLKQIKKTPAEWEEVLAKMKWMGVRLSDTERIALIDYLAIADGE